MVKFDGLNELALISKYPPVGFDNDRDGALGVVAVLVVVPVTSLKTIVPTVAAEGADRIVQSVLNGKFKSSVVSALPP